ncbi:hypothetical protein J2847_003352 [Azospirillum agricola]|uniref:hypothetical protein n=1 Tax=Azospirillum agricola TaxID=1720247 RepID=UPI001AE344EC|nr:hypothetical protein [Azospirillum agricola]MBP2230049.1 hypothetical protein [Azospirillum agricola]
MAEKRKITLHVKNATQGMMWRLAYDLSHGKWKQQSAETIASGATDTYISTGMSDTATGTTGYVRYLLWDRIATVQLNWSIGYSASNSGGPVLDGNTKDAFSARLTNDSYSDVVSFPQAGDANTYWLISDVAAVRTSPDGLRSASDRSGSLADLLAARLAGLSRVDVGDRRIDIPGALNAIPCGKYDEADLTRLSAGRTQASLHEVLETKLPAIEMLKFLGSSDLVPAWHAATASADFVDEKLEIIPDLSLRRLVEGAVSAVRDALSGRPIAYVDDLAGELEAAKAALMGLEHSEDMAVQVAMVEAALALLHQKPSSMLETVGSSVRATVEKDTVRFARLSGEQLTRLRAIIG